MHTLKARIWRQELKPSPWKNAGYWHASWLFQLHITTCQGKCIQIWLEDNITDIFSHLIFFLSNWMQLVSSWQKPNENTVCFCSVSLACDETFYHFISLFHRMDRLTFHVLLIRNNFENSRSYHGSWSYWKWLILSSLPVLGDIREKRQWDCLTQGLVICVLMS